MAASRRDARAIEHVSRESPEVFDDHIFVRKLIEEVPAAFAYLPRSHKYDRDVVTHAIHIDGLALKHAAPAFRDDEEVVMAAVTRNWRALEFASLRLKADRSIVRAA